eukprot:TRINITY_DN5913_c1_g1_i1.p1 TRINITY_DN5913_c1_g1~~TRINITY_DN5913_c1_g1_i1.p1  ORF type:complete len:225 (-),score=54.52 TRINITY_DN5913_c1_g1_i1:137-811(-)
MKMTKNNDPTQINIVRVVFAAVHLTILAGLGLTYMKMTKNNDLTKLKKYYLKKTANVPTLIPESLQAMMGNKKSDKKFISKEKRDEIMAENIKYEEYVKNNKDNKEALDANPHKKVQILEDNTQTVLEHDMEEFNKQFKKILTIMILLTGIHLYFGVIPPLIIQSGLNGKNLIIDNKLFKTYILGQKVERPWNIGGDGLMDQLEGKMEELQEMQKNMQEDEKNK